MLDRASNEFCVWVIGSSDCALLLGPLETFVKPFGKVLVGFFGDVFIVFRFRNKVETYFRYC